MRVAPSLRPLFPSGSIVLAASVEGPLSRERREAFLAALRGRLAAEDLVLAEPGTPGAVPVVLRVVLERDGGTTEAGTGFLGAAARAVLEVGRGSHELRGRAFAGTDAEDLANRALDDLLDRAVLALTF